LLFYNSYAIVKTYKSNRKNKKMPSPESTPQMITVPEGMVAERTYQTPEPIVIDPFAQEQAKQRIIDNQKLVHAAYDAEVAKSEAIEANKNKPL
jgi:hypothetical protein